MKVAFITGGTGFIGKQTVKRFVNEGYEVMVLIRDKKIRGTKGDVEKTVPAKERLADVCKELGLNEKESSQLHAIEGDLSDLKVGEVSTQIKDTMSELGSSEIDSVVSCAAQLKMDYEIKLPSDENSLSEEDKKKQAARLRKHEAKMNRWREGNRKTNFEGLSNLLKVFDEIEGNTPHVPRIEGNTPHVPRVRVLRPSVVVGPGSSDAYMAFIDYLNQDVSIKDLPGIGTFVPKFLASKIPKISLAKLFKNLFPFTPKGLPMPGNPEAIIDIVDENEVNQAILAFTTDDAKNAREELGDSHHGEGIRVLSIQHISTAYVNATEGGEIAEGPVSVEGKKFHNSYEETKAQAEQKLREWVRGRIAKKLGKELNDGDVESQLENVMKYNHLANPNSPTLQELTRDTIMAFGIEEKYVSKVKIVGSEDFSEAMGEFATSRSPVARILAVYVINLFENYAPMLEPYLGREGGAKYSVENTRKDLAELGWVWDPEPKSARYIRERLLEGKPYDEVLEIAKEGERRGVWMHPEGPEGASKYWEKRNSNIEGSNPNGPER